MKCQIALVGGQLLPVYLGIKEYQPEKVIFLLTKESRDTVSRIKDLFDTIVFEIIVVDPYDFEQIKLVTKQAIDDNGSDIQLNLTGGTKVMALATNSVFEEQGLESVYYDQSGRFYSFLSRSYQEIQEDVDIKTFLHLSGHDQYTTQRLDDYSSSEFEMASEMHELIKNEDVESLFKKASYDLGFKDLSKGYRKRFGSGTINWDGRVLRFDTDRTSRVFTNPRALEICFTGLWWELKVASEVNCWMLKKEMLLSVELKTNDGQNLAKNEIDIVLNTGKNLVFIECKSGNVKQADVNKMRAVKRLYGGVSARSILICRKKPRKDLLEKCKDLDVDVFYFMEENKTGQKRQWTFNSLDEINGMLTSLVEKSEL